MEAARIIRNLGYRGLIIGVTGNCLKDDVDKFMEAGADCVFAKPFRDKDLTSLLQFIEQHGCETNPALRAAIVKLTSHKLSKNR